MKVKWLSASQLQQLRCLGHLLFGEPLRVAGGDLLGDAQRGGSHLRPVLDGLAHVAQHTLEVGGQHLVTGDVGAAIDLYVHPRLDQLVGVRRAGARRVGHRDQRAGDVAPHDELRVHDQLDRPAVAAELGGDRVDEERHVVGDDLDDAVPVGGPAVAFSGRGW